MTIRERASAKELKDFWDWTYDNKIGECDTEDEWCRAQLFVSTEKIMSCVIEQNKPISECVAIEKERWGTPSGFITKKRRY